MSLMSIGGFALTSDHTHLVYQHSILKAATDAASLAAARHWQRSPSLSHLTDDQLAAALTPIVKRYVLANIPKGRRARAAATLNIVELKPNRALGTVNIVATVDLGGVIFSRWVDSLDGEEDLTDLNTMQGETLTERVESITEVVLAIDMTGSMSFSLLSDMDPAEGEDSRMDVVKRAAKDLVDILTSSNNPVAIGLVPWNFIVRLDETTRTRWEDLGWAEYPNYPNQPRLYYPNPDNQNSTGEWHDLPSKPVAWRGCPDQRDISGVNPPGFSVALPQVSPFTMGFYTSTMPELNSARHSISYQCYNYWTTSRSNKWCYDGSLSSSISPQFLCEEYQGSTQIVPLTTDSDMIKTAIDALSVPNLGATTYSTLGVVWGHRLLAPTWRTIWGDGNAIHPVDPEQHEGTQKALVLLTDGADTHLYPVGTSLSVGPDYPAMREHRNTACTSAKNAGIKVFTIAAMPPDRVGSLGSELEQCSSKADDPSGQYVFVNNVTSEALRNAFQQIAWQLVRFRRVY